MKKGKINPVMFVRLFINAIKPANLKIIDRVM